jgi:hypothetical protein
MQTVPKRDRHSRGCRKVWKAFLVAKVLSLAQGRLIKLARWAKLSSGERLAL